MYRFRYPRVHHSLPVAARRVRRATGSGCTAMRSTVCLEFRCRFGETHLAFRSSSFLYGCEAAEQFQSCADCLHDAGSGRVLCILE